MLIRLFTENKNYEQVCDIVKQHFEAFTVFTANGYWQGQREKCLVIEISNNDNPRISSYTQSDIDKICYAIKKLNKQDKILVQQIQCESKLI